MVLARLMRFIFLYIWFIFDVVSPHNITGSKFKTHYFDFTGPKCEVKSVGWTGAQ